MSRSYKKNPVFTDYTRHGTRWAKARANRLFRRCGYESELRAGKSAVHRKFTESWDIHDYVYRWSKEDAESDWEREERQIAAGAVPSRRVCQWHFQFDTKERFLIYWRKSMTRK